MHSSVLSHLADALAHEPDGPDYALPVDEIYTLLRLCLLRRDGRFLRAHRDAARHVHQLVMAAYRDAGAYIGTWGGMCYADGAAVRSVVQTLCAAAPTPLPLPRPPDRRAGEATGPG